MPLSGKDKSKASHGYGYDFHHTDPQRRVPCVLGGMLCPLSADDIPPISADAMSSVLAGLELLACLVEDREHNLYLGCSGQQATYQEKANEIRLAAAGLVGILRMSDTPRAAKVIDDQVERFVRGIRCCHCQSDLEFKADDVFSTCTRPLDGGLWFIRCGACGLPVEVGAVIPGWLKGRARAEKTS